MAGLQERVRNQLRRSDGIEPAKSGAPDEWVVTTTPFDARIFVENRIDDSEAIDSPDAIVGPNGDHLSDSGRSSPDSTPNETANRTPKVDRERNRELIEGSNAGERMALRTVVVVPTLSEAVESHVAAVVESGWLETFERRLSEAGMALAGFDEVSPMTSIDSGMVEIQVTIIDEDARRGIENARTFVEYVEGTYMEGIIPGYEYREPVAGLRERARDRA